MLDEHPSMRSVASVAILRGCRPGRMSGVNATCPRLHRAALLFLFLASGACGAGPATTDPVADAGAGTGTGGGQGTGGTANAGGAQGTGGTVNTGGVQGTGGTANTGGMQGTGGRVGTGGAQGTGGAGGRVSSTGGSPGAGGGAGSAALGFAADIWPVFAQVRQPPFVYRGTGSYQGCTAASPCHGRANPGARLSMTDADAAYRALFQVASTSSLCAGAVRVIPGNPDGSCLVRFYQGRLKDDLQWVPQSEIELMRRWIAEGARP